MPPKHESRSHRKPKSILKHRKHGPTPQPAAEAPAGEAAPAQEPPPELPSREKSNDAAPTIRSNSKRACNLLMRIKEDQSPVASFFGIARLKGSALELHKLLKEEGGNVRTGEHDIRRLFKGEPRRVQALLEQDAELPEKTSEQPSMCIWIEVADASDIKSKRRPSSCQSIVSSTRSLSHPWRSHSEPTAGRSPTTAIFASRPSFSLTRHERLATR